MASFPIVLAHGIARFDFIAARLGNGDYFKPIAKALRKRGFVVYEANVDFAGSLETRGRGLQREIEAYCQREGVQKVHVIAHSMGGLDARWAIINGAASRVASLTTIGTPHLGTPFADRGVDVAGLVIPLLKRIALDLEGFAALSEEACRRFNDHAEPLEARNDVRYATYSSSQERELIFLPLLRSFDVISAESGANDGLVPVRSQAWKPKLTAPGGDGTVDKTVEQRAFPVPADHLNQLARWHAGGLRQTPLGFLKRLLERRRYENAVRQVYVDAAHAATRGAMG